MDAEQASKILLVAGRTLFQHGKQLDELITKIQANVEVFEEAKYKMFGGLDDSLREAIFSLSGLPTENNDDRIVDDIGTLLSDYFFHDEVDEADSIKRIEDRLRELVEARR